MARVEAYRSALDPDVRWLLLEVLRKGRLKRMDAAWVARSVARLT